MAAAAPYVKLLRHLSSARDEYRSGVLDITWEGGSASIYMVFGQPNHATFESEDGRNLTGQEAITALVTGLPPKFKIEPWRKAVIRTETLRLSIDELLEPFAQLAGKVTADRVDHEASIFGVDSLPLLDFGLSDFPLLPRGKVLWSDSAANVLELDSILPQLPPALVTLNGPKLRAAAVVSRGQIVDAVWVDDEEQAVGETAAIALMGSSEGVVSGFELEDQRIAEALPMLWRFPKAHQNLSTEWINPQKFVEGILNEHGDCAVVISGQNPGVALFANRELVGVYSQSDPHVSPSIDMLYELIQGDKAATISIREMARDLNVARDVAPQSSEYSAVADRDVDEGSPALTEAGRLPAPPPWNPPPEAQNWFSGAHLAPSDTFADLPAAEDEEEITVSDEEPPQAGNEELTVDEEPFSSIEAAAANNFQAPEDDGYAPEAEPASDDEPPQFTLVPPDSPPTEEPVPEFTIAPAAPSLLPEPGTPFAPLSLEPLDGGLAASGDEVPTWFSSPAPLPQMAPMSSSADSSSTAVAPSRLDLDFDEVRGELIQISVLWLGEDQNGPVQSIIEHAPPTVDDFVRAIDTVRNLTIDGVDQSVIRAMAREMHYHAAECLCGA